MAKGRKPKLVNGSNVVAMPLFDEPQAIHFARAKELRPDHELNDYERSVWDRTAPQMAMLGRLQPHFVDALTEYCHVRNRLHVARKELDKTGWVYESETRNGLQYKSMPQVAQLNDDWRKWRSMIAEFGLAPASERGMLSGQGDTHDDFDKF